MKALRLLFLFLLITLANRPVWGETGFQMDSMMLYQEDNTLRARAVEVTTLGEFVKQIETTCSQFFAKTDRPESLDVVVAVKPGKKSRVWFVSSIRKDQKELEPLRKKLEAIPAMTVKQGPVVFALKGLIAGGDSKKAEKESPPNLPIPSEWKDAATSVKQNLAVPDGFLELVWPDTAEDIKLRESAQPPDGFIYQELDPLGGRALRPKDWFYASHHNQSSFLWIFSKEDLDKTKSYTTGVRIQMLLGVKKSTGMSAKEFIADFVAKKKKSADKVHKTCEAVKQTFFTRMCLETEEGPHRILYSLFWSDEVDMMVVSIAGTTLELWGSNTAIFDTMNQFEPLKVEALEKFVQDAAAPKKPEESDAPEGKR